jgi:hypothetical protein
MHPLYRHVMLFLGLFDSAPNGQHAPQQHHNAPHYVVCQHTFERLRSRHGFLRQVGDEGVKQYMDSGCYGRGLLGSYWPALPLSRLSDTTQLKVAEFGLKTEILQGHEMLIALLADEP